MTINEKIGFDDFIWDVTYQRTKARESTRQCKWTELQWTMQPGEIPPPVPNYSEKGGYSPPPILIPREAKHNRLQGANIHDCSKRPVMATAVSEYQDYAEIAKLFDVHRYRYAPLIRAMSQKAFRRAGAFILEHAPFEVETKDRKPTPWPRFGTSEWRDLEGEVWIHWMKKLAGLERCSSLYVINSINNYLRTHRRAGQLRFDITAKFYNNVMNATSRVVYRGGKTPYRVTSDKLKYSEKLSRSRVVDSITM